MDGWMDVKKQYSGLKNMHMFSTNQTFSSCFSVLLKVIVPSVGLKMLLNCGCTLKESTLVRISMEPGVKIPDHSLGRKAGFGW